MERCNDGQGRWRNKKVGFRMSVEENILLEQYVKLTGMTKQDYIISRLLQREVVVHGNTRVYKALRNQMLDIYTELQKIQVGDELREDMIMQLSQVLFILKEMKEE